MTFAEFLKSVGAVEGSIAAAYYGAAWGAATAAERERWQRIADAAQAVTEGAEDIGDFIVSSSLMASLALALDEGPNVKLSGCEAVRSNDS